jgi:hypothetical protein
MTVKDPTLQRIFGLGDNPDGLGQNYATRESTGPGSGLEHVPLYARGPATLINHGAARTIGQADTGGTIIAGLTGMVVNAGSGAVVGMALAPERDKRTIYAITGAVLTVVFGPLGMMSQAAFVLLTRERGS